MSAGFASDTLRFRLGGNLDLALVDFLLDHFLRGQSLLLGLVLRFLNFNRGQSFGDFPVCRAAACFTASLALASAISALAVFSPMTA